MSEDSSSNIKFPKVSIVIPVYNGSNYLNEAIDSALGQTYKNIEVLVIDDGSNDNEKTQRIALNYGEKIRYIKKENGGVSSALNLGIKEMKGEYLSWLSHDDVYYPKKVEKQIELLNNQVNKDIILYSDYDYIDDNSNYLESVKVDHIKPFRICLLSSWPVNGCTTLIKKSILYEFGLFDEIAKYSQDYSLWFKIAKKYDFIHISESLIKSRIHDAQGTLMFSDKAHIEIALMYKNFIDILFIEENIESLLKNRIYIIEGLKLKNQIYLIFYFLECLTKNQNLIGIEKFKIKIKEISYFHLLIKKSIIHQMVLFKRRLVMIIHRIFKLATIVN